jgi:hypothetical protein
MITDSVSRRRVHGVTAPSAMVGLPITWCRRLTGSWLVTMVEPSPWLVDGRSGSASPGVVNSIEDARQDVSALRSAERCVGDEKCIDGAPSRLACGPHPSRQHGSHEPVDCSNSQIPSLPILNCGDQRILIRHPLGIPTDSPKVETALAKLGCTCSPGRITYPYARIQCLEATGNRSQHGVGQAPMAA